MAHKRRSKSKAKRTIAHRKDVQAHRKIAALRIRAEEKLGGFKFSQAQKREILSAYEKGLAKVESDLRKLRG